MTAVWLDCPTHGYVQATNLVDIAPGSGATFKTSQGRCPEDGHSVPMVDGHYTTSSMGTVKLEPIPGDADSAEQIRKLREQHPDA